MGGSKVINHLNPKDEPAITGYLRQNPDAISLIDYHFICPMPRAVVPSRIILWCRKHCEYGWLIQMPRKGQPTWRNTVILFECELEMSAFRDHYCFDDKYHQRPNGLEWMDLLGDNQ